MTRQLPCGDKYCMALESRKGFKPNARFRDEKTDPLKHERPLLTGTFVGLRIALFCR